MNLRLPNLKTRTGKRTAAFTLPEMMMGLLTGLMILGSACVVLVFMDRTLDATMNYEELDRQSRNALDLMSMDIRGTGGLTNYTTNALSFTNTDGSLLQYSWNTTNKLLTYTNASTTLAGCPRGGTLLEGCQALKFSIYQRNPSNGTTMTFWPAPSTNPSLTKVVVMDWICTRTNYGSLTDSESVQTAKVVMRN